MGESRQQQLALIKTEAGIAHYFARGIELNVQGKGRGLIIFDLSPRTPPPPSPLARGSISKLRAITAKTEVCMAHY